MWLGHFIRAALLIFLAVNLYAVTLRVFPVPTTILMVQRGVGGDEIKREWVPLEEMSPHIVEAVMAGEDSRFCDHKGIDWEAIEQAFESNQAGGRRRGGSTITQQTAKNVFFWNGGGYWRKAGEAWFASLIDFTWGKSRVMEVYLNVAEWGNGVFGIEAAAQTRFGKAAKDLSQQEAALLAAVLPSPNKWRLDPPSEFVQKRAGILRQRMKVIQNSAYADCITGLAPRKMTPPRVTNKDPAPVDKESEATLEEVLSAAEDSLKEKENEMIENEPKPKPDELPPVDPSTIPHEPDTVPPTPSPEFPDNMPQEVPAETPPTEIPHPDGL